MYFNSGRQLREELTGIRLAAANTSLWHIAQHIDVRARIAIDDALRTYPMPVHRVYSSVYILSAGVTLAVPWHVHRILSLTPVINTSGFNLETFRHIPGMHTNLVHITVSPSTTSNFWARMEYEEMVDHLPADVSVPAAIGSGVNVYATPANAFELGAAGWRDQGHLEISCLASPGLVEAVYYTSVGGTQGFYLTQRGLLGTAPVSWAAASSIRLSPYVLLPPDARPVIMKAAEANMYEYWAGHRAMYDQYTAVTGIAQMDLADVLAMNRVLDDTAERRYEKLQTRRLPAPTRAQVSKRGDVII